MMQALSSFFAILPYFLKVLVVGAMATVSITVGSALIALVVGFPLALMRLSDSAIARFLATAYLELFRNIPLLTQLFILYFGLTTFGINLPATAAALLGFGLNGGALTSEVFRGSIAAVDRGQAEAAMSIGMSRGAALRWIVLPQAIRVALPSLGNFVIGLLKDTSLASVAAVPEIVFRGRMLVAETYRTNEIYLLIAVIYLVLSLIIARIFKAGERRSSRHIKIRA